MLGAAEHPVSPSRPSCTIPITAQISLSQAAHVETLAATAICSSSLAIWSYDFHLQYNPSLIPEVLGIKKKYVIKKDLLHDKRLSSFLREHPVLPAAESLHLVSWELPLVVTITNNVSHTLLSEQHVISM